MPIVEARPSSPLDLSPFGSPGTPKSQTLLTGVGVRQHALSPIRVPKGFIAELLELKCIVRRCDGVFYVRLTTEAAITKYADWLDACGENDPHIDVFTGIVLPPGAIPPADPLAVLAEANAIAFQYGKLRAADIRAAPGGAPLFLDVPSMQIG